MKRIHIRKPDIKGKFQKLRHLKKEDIKEYWHKKKLRREAILEKRRNSAFAKKMQPVYKVMNRFSLLLHVLYACLINLVIESISRHSFFCSMGLYGRFALDIFVQYVLDIYHIFTRILGEKTCFCAYIDYCFLDDTWYHKWLYADGESIYAQKHVFSPSIRVKM